jgi:hypothetical protein
MSKKEETAQRLHWASKVLQASWESHLEQKRGELSVAAALEYEDTLVLENSPKFRMIDHLVRQARREKQSILVFTGALTLACMCGMHLSDSILCMCGMHSSQSYSGALSRCANTE